VDADLEDYFGSPDQDKVTTLIGKQIADGRVLGLIQEMLTAGTMTRKARRFRPRGNPARACHLVVSEQYPAESQNQ
jgi:RNA-directed DNA polymerase